MLKYWSATSLLALALLGCFVEQGVEAQGDSVLQPRLSIVHGKPSSPPSQTANTPQSGIGTLLNPSQGPGYPWGSHPSTGHGSHLGSNPTTGHGSHLGSHPSTGQGSHLGSHPSTGQGSHLGSNPFTGQGSHLGSNPTTPTGTGPHRQQLTPSSNPFGQSQRQRPPGLSNPTVSQWGFSPSTTSGSQPSSSQHTGHQWGMSPGKPIGTQKQQLNPNVQQGQNHPLNSHNPFGHSPGHSKPTVSQGQSQPHRSQHGNQPGLHWGLSGPSVSHRPTISSNPPGIQTKPSWPPKSGNPPYSKNPPINIPQKTSFGPRTSQTPQKQLPTTYDPSQEFTHLTSVAKDSDQVTCDTPHDLNPPCGGKDISPGACQAMGCCYDGSRCYFAKTVTVQCTKTGEFIVVVAKDVTQPRIDVDTISLRGSGPNCHYVDSNSEFAIYHFNASECGTTVSEEELGIIVYENAMESYFEVQSGNLGQITRDSKYMVAFQCRYTATSVEALVFQLSPSDSPLPVFSSGPVRVQMKLGNGQCITKGCDEVVAAYTSFYLENDYPVSKVLREPVFVEVEVLDIIDPLVHLTLDRCWTTTSANPDEWPQWDILINGCPNPADPYMSELVPVGPESPNKRRFFFKMFAFTDILEEASQQVYIHCSTSLCLLAPGGNCEPLCYRKFKKREAPITEKKTKPTVVVSSGPVNFSSTKI